MHISTEDHLKEAGVQSMDTVQTNIVWRNIILFAVLHAAGVYGLYLCCTSVMWLTNLYLFGLIGLSGLGVTAGAHRLYAHKSYKARLPLQILLVIFNTIAMQESVIDWVRDHRMHHKYSETNADPYNAKRGFFFSHIGWLMMKKHPDIKAKGHTVDMSDILNNPILRFQKRYYAILAPLACFVLPTYIATLWGESLWNAFFVCAVFRYIYTLNGTWLVNSAAHMWGNKPYNKHINPVENYFVSFIALGEGFHNYHHSFPWDYKTAELDSNFGGLHEAAIKSAKTHLRSPHPGTLCEYDLTSTLTGKLGRWQVVHQMSQQFWHLWGNVGFWVISIRQPPHMRAELPQKTTARSCYALPTVRSSNHWWDNQDHSGAELVEEAAQIQFFMGFL
ncbi:unnamed protein product [Arctia plantaginis]|nr:unnamed protein product [Arctia plantaginis]